MAGGLPLQTITAPNIHRISKYGREVCKQAGKSNIPNKRCGSKRTHYAPSRKHILFVGIVLVFLIELIHDQLLHGFQLLLIFNSTEDRLTIFFHGL